MGGTKRNATAGAGTASPRMASTIFGDVPEEELNRGTRFESANKFSVRA